MPHSPEVAEALEKSIQHWRENRDAPVEKTAVSSSDCALCGLFNHLHMPHSDRCWGCPVAQGAPSRRFCENTPYDLVDLVYTRLLLSPSSEERVADWRELCNREIAFLESLRDPPAE